MVTQSSNSSYHSLGGGAKNVWTSSEDTSNKEFEDQIISRPNKNNNAGPDMIILDQK